MRLKSLFLFIFAAFLFASCSTINSLNRVRKTDTLLTGLFNNDPAKLSAAYDAVKKDMTMEEVVALGINPNAKGIKNITKLSGNGAYKYLCGGEHQTASYCSEKAESLKDKILERQKYQVWLIPFKKLDTEENSNLIATNKSSVENGPSRYYEITFYEKKVLSKDIPEDTIKAEVKTETKSFWKGMFDSVIDLGSKVGRRF